MKTKKYGADSYERGDFVLREAAGVLDMTTRETLDLFWDMGITGNVNADKTFKAISFVQKKLVKTG